MSSKNKDASKLLGEKLLQGWTMLGDVCPNENCEGVPLMRERGTKRMVCVACNTFYTIDSNDSIVPEQKPIQQQQQPTPATTIPTASPKVEEVTNSGNSDWNRVKKATLQTLISKIESETALIAPATTTASIIEHCNAIQELAKTISIIGHP